MVEFKVYLKFMLKAVAILTAVFIIAALFFDPMGLAWFLSSIF